jgi:oxygen-independent coproporphyrinogen-3 oxidase
LQSFNDEELRWMNRAHNAQESVRSVKLAQDAGLDNITIDLIYGSKFQTLDSWRRTLQQAIELQTNHISSYNLTIENKTALGAMHKKGSEPGVNDELSNSQFLLMIDMLEENRFIQYEISNFGKKDFFAKHNTNYWLGKQYLGLGPSAHSYNLHSRQWNIKNNPLYIKKISSGEVYYEVESLSDKDKYNEYVLTRLRTIFGCDIKEMNDLFDASIVSHFLAGVEIKKENFTLTDGKYVLNRNGKLYADGIASDLFLT